MDGYMGTLLRVNLTDRRITKEPLNKTLTQEFVGGRGLNSKMLYDELTPGTDPLGPENEIIIGTGPCAGTLVPGSSRFTISSKSPLTGFLGDSNAGGFFGVGLKYAGYDAVIIEGQSERPVYLFIDDDRVEIRDARQHWGRSALATTRAIQKENFDPGIYVISIGLAGENQVRFGNLMTDLGRAAGRTGQGAVFGSKKLKAIAVRGRKGVRVANPAALMEAAGEIHKAWTASSGEAGRLNRPAELRARYGPAAGLKIGRPADNKGFIKSLKNGHEIFVYILDAIDIELEINRINNEIRKVMQEKYKSSEKIENPQFLDKAPKDIIKKEKSKLIQDLKIIQSLQEQLNLLQSIK